MTGPTDLRCTVQTRGLGERPAGSATAAEHFILVELPMPWPDKIENHPMLAGLPVSPPEQSRPRILAIRGDDERQGHSTQLRIISYRRSAGPFTAFSRAEADVAEDKVHAVLSGLIETPEQVIGNELARFTDDILDVLLCTHGSRDRCCGQMGSLLYLEVAQSLPARARVWRTSHTGGHRFAPTGITFPDGLTWSFLDASLLRAVVDRSVDPGDLGAHLRGCAGFTSRQAQIADTVAFQQLGWPWLDLPRDLVVTPVEGSRPEFEVFVAGSSRQFLVRMVEDDAVPVPLCGEPLGDAKKQTVQFVVTSVDEQRERPTPSTD